MVTFNSKAMRKLAFFLLFLLPIPLSSYRNVEGTVQNMVHRDTITVDIKADNPTVRVYNHADKAAAQFWYGKYTENSNALKAMLNEIVKQNLVIANEVGSADRPLLPELSYKTGYSIGQINKFIRQEYAMSKKIKISLLGALVTILLLLISYYSIYAKALLISNSKSMLSHMIISGIFIVIVMVSILGIAFSLSNNFEYFKLHYLIHMLQ